MPAHLLHGDSYLVSRALKELQEQIGPPEALEANSHTISGSRTNLAEITTVCNAMPFLAEYRLVVVEGLLSQSEAREGRRRGNTSTGGGTPAGSGRNSQSAWDELPRYIEEEMPPSTLLVFMESSLSRRNPLLQKLQPVVHAQELPTPSGEGLARWVRNRVTEKGAQITPGAISLLTQLVGGNLRTVDNELEKLTLYARDRAIEEGDVQLLVSQAREASIFSAVDALLEGRPAIALQLMHRLRDDGAEFPYIVAMIARQLRLTTLARDLIDRNHGEKDIGSRLGINRDFALRKTVEQARKHSPSSLEWLYRSLLDADLAVKRGRLEQDLALELLVSESSGLVAASGKRRQR